MHNSTTSGSLAKTETINSSKSASNMRTDLVSIFYRKHKEKATKYIPSDLQFASYSPIVNSTAHQMYSITKSPRFK